MNNSNPFQKIEGGKPSAPVPPAPAAPETPLLCPILGNMVVPVFPKAGIVGPSGARSQEVGLEAKMFGCQGPKCVFWSPVAEDCKFRMQAEAQIEATRLLGELTVLLAPLATFFGAKR